MKLRQYTIRSGATFQTCWLEEGRAKEGDSVTLKDSDDPERLWKIEKAYSAIDSGNINRGWDNNI